MRTFEVYIAIILQSSDLFIPAKWRIRSISFKASFSTDVLHTEAHPRQPSSGGECATTLGCSVWRLRALASGESGASWCLSRERCRGLNELNRSSFRSSTDLFTAYSGCTWPDVFKLVFTQTFACLLAWILLANLLWIHLAGCFYVQN